MARSSIFGRQQQLPYSRAILAAMVCVTGLVFVKWAFSSSSSLQNSSTWYSSTQPSTSQRVAVANSILLRRYAALSAQFTGFESILHKWRDDDVVRPYCALSAFAQTPGLVQMAVKLYRDAADDDVAFCRGLAIISSQVGWPATDSTVRRRW